MEQYILKYLIKCVIDIPSVVTMLNESEQNGRLVENEKTRTKTDA